MRGSKDTVLAFGVRTLLNSRLSAIGKITDLTVDTAHRRAQLRMALRGEPGAIDVADLRYDIQHADGSDWLTLVDAVASREWLTAALKQFAVGRSFHLSTQRGQVPAAVDVGLPCERTAELRAMPILDSTHPPTLYPCASWSFQMSVV